jgi:hypothetical protein
MVGMLVPLAAKVLHVIITKIVGPIRAPSVLGTFKNLSQHSSYYCSLFLKRGHCYTPTDFMPGLRDQCSVSPSLASAVLAARSSGPSSLTCAQTDQRRTTIAFSSLDPSNSSALASPSPSPSAFRSASMRTAPATSAARLRVPPFRASGPSARAPPPRTASQHRPLQPRA